MLSFIGHNTSADVVLFDNLRIWAERGLIHIESTTDGDYKVVSVKTMLERMKGVSDMLGNSSARDINTESQFDRAWRKRNQDMIDGMIRVVRKAQEQGMPSDAGASRDLVRRAKKTFVVTGLNAGM